VIFGDQEAQHVSIVVPEHKARERIDIFLTREISHISRNRIQQLIRQGVVKVNGQAVKANHMVVASEKIDVLLAKSRPMDVIPERIPLDIVYEDDHLIVVNKKAGMVVHPAVGHYSGTLVNALLAHSQILSGTGDPCRPGIVHRIDKDTSGLLVVAKNDLVHRKLSDQFRAKTTRRLYQAVVWGKPAKSSGVIETNLARSTRDRKKIAVSQAGRTAVTHYRILGRYPLVTWLELNLETGRTHQIRVHLAHIGHPVLGDQTYGGRGRRLGGLNNRETRLAMTLLELMPRQALHAKSLGFLHPVTQKELFFDSDLPEDMQHVIDYLKHAAQNESH